MALRKFLLATWCLLVCTGPILGQNNGATDNEPEFFKFDLKNRAIGSVVKQPELVLPNGNSYAQRVESDLSIDIPGVTENFLVKVDAAIDSVIAEVTNSHLDGRTLLEQKGLQIDPFAVAMSSDIFLQRYTPILGGQSSNITNYHLVAIVDLKPLQAEMNYLWGEILLGERLIQYIMIASVILIVLFLLRGNQVMRSRNTNPPIRIMINVIILVTTLATLALFATMLYWV